MIEIFYITNARMPTEKAHGLQIAKMCEAFSNQGNKVTLVVPDFKGSNVGDLFSYYDIKRIFKVKYFPVFNFYKYDKFLGPLAHFLINFNFLIKVYLSFDKKRKVVVYSRTASVAALCSFSGFYTIYEAHNVPRNSISRLLLHFFLSRVDKVVCNSFGTREALASNGLKKLIVAVNGVDVDSFKIIVDRENVRRKLGIPNDKKVVMYVGSLMAWKGISVFLDTSKIMGKEYVFVVIGGYHDEIESLKKRYPDVIFLGPKPYKDLPFNQKAADFLVIPNTSKDIESLKYTSPIKLFAHMLSGIPVLVSDLPSMRSIVNEDIVFFFAPDSPTSLAQKIEEIDHASFLGEKLKRAENFAELHSWDARAKKIVNLIDVEK